MNKVRAHLHISGIVQGVFFRHYTFETAHKLGLTGWVRNLANGQVETVFEGPKDKIDEMVKWCQQGPDSARVTSVDIKWETADGTLTGFNIE
ncbi:MAG: acylphosphatase [Planctomycetes bacterium]|nr:acylphosphatase [Planctomycetota bacterium]